MIGIPKGKGGESLRQMTRSFGVDIAKVTNVKDPNKLNRVKCQIISNDKSIGETNWAMVSSFMSGTQRGAAFFPSVGDMVILAYIGGDVHRPVVIGHVWTQNSQAPRNYGANGENDIRSIKTASGAEIVIDDTTAKQKITITTPAGATLTLDDGGNTIKLQNKTGTNGIVMNTQRGEVTIKANKKLTLEAGTSKLILDGAAAQKATLSAGNAVQINGVQVNVKASGKMDLTASGSMMVKSTGITQVKGSMLKLN